MSRGARTGTVRLAAALAMAALAMAALAAAALAGPAAGAQFGLRGLDVTFTDSQGNADMRAGAHPFAMTTSFEVNTEDNPELGIVPVDAVKDLIVRLPVGLAGDPRATPRCSAVDFADVTAGLPACADSSAVGRAEVSIGFNADGPHEYTVPVYNLQPPPGAPAKLGFVVLTVPVTLEARIEPHPPYNLLAPVTNIPQPLRFFGTRFTLWGVPGDPAHDDQRGACAATATGCEAGAGERPFLTLPRSCGGPLASSFEADSWQHPGAWLTYSLESHDDATPPAPLGAIDCAALGFHPTISSRPSTRAAQSPTGLDFGLDVEDLGLLSPDGRANADIAKAVVALPEGMSVNPSQAEGLGVCGEADLARERLGSAFGAGCPGSSKIGTIEVETPLLEGEILHGSLFVAEPYHNLAGDSLIALYVVIKDPGLGIQIVQPLKVEPDPRSGRLITTASDMPQLPFSHFRLRFREGARAPLISPPGCGSFQTTAKLYPSSGGPMVESTDAFQIASGPGGGPCPSGAAPFDPGFEAGALSNAAGRYSPFHMRITRGDGEQDITKFSAVLPAGVVARLAGTTWCPEAGIARAKSRTGENGGRQEIDDPSCPAGSKIGTTLAGAGVGGQLTYVPGSLYLAGPYNGAPLSVAAITPAVAGPFDAGTVVVREALALNPVSGVAEVDGAASDPIPHILKGIPLNLRELRVAVDRPGFTLNATSCEEEQTEATLWGGGTVLAPTPDSPVGLSSRYQAAGCRGLAFKPRLAIRLYGGTRRGAHPALRAIVRPRPGQANFARAAVTLPHSAFLEQAHIRTVCTRVQFAAGAGHGERCPRAAIYGHAKAWSPLIEGPATGPVYLRSSNHKLPDLVVALRGPASAPVEVELASRIDSVRGGIRSIFTGIPDLPVSRFVLAMQGGRKGLIVNSRNLCRKPKRNRARANLTGQNGRRERIKPVVRALKCGKAKDKDKRHRRHYRPR